MADDTLGQAIRNAVEAERAAGRFYRLLAESTADAGAAAFLRRLSAQEEEHAAAIERLGERLHRGELPRRADDHVQLVEAIPEWRWVDGITLFDALSVAREAEVHAGLFYGALADATDGPVRDFFRSLAATEEAHVRDLDAERRRR